MSVTNDIRILVVEDDALFRAVLEKRLGLEGFDVRVAADGREGMRAIVAEAPDLVVSDWMMPHVDGLELCQSVKTGLKDDAPYFILLTAKGQVSDRVLALKTGADDYLIKPCDLVEVVVRVRTGVRVVRGKRDLRRMHREVVDARQKLKERERQLEQLSLLVPSCPECARVHTGEGNWEDLATYLRRTCAPDSVQESCPECRLRRRRAA